MHPAWGVGGEELRDDTFVTVSNNRMKGLCHFPERRGGPTSETGITLLSCALETPERRSEEAGEIIRRRNQWDLGDTHLTSQPEPFSDHGWHPWSKQIILNLALRPLMTLPSIDSFLIPSSSPLCFHTFGNSPQALQIRCQTPVCVVPYS